ncbi:uncharacterized protein CANTADRAFT_52782 [Suhomyces tanzawaensis NRRL Y-17324]|uniref:Uncharacterized protein n=1 Tax=Suhomyces tanzawaensis NRRL Y-17324 TaxID=984487 RepID=A0A1E4SH20_9ASCO|nr:uncharacterized protein CANTADRAFT_52782 [Suhomyces tanzawaensis NRRL Y-17324]ODV78786.1 hypothetical protein CANTADRAFT_52782 [Suhomyces tanzawaensis NRRL Y-17324]
MCKSEICGICHHKSWSGCGQHVGLVMDPTPKSLWCTCEPIDVNGSQMDLLGVSYPPRAGTGFARKSV